MATLLNLKYDIVRGPFGNTFIKTKIDGKPEKLPFESIYLREAPKEVLKFLSGKYNIRQYRNLEFNELSHFNYKKHSIFYGFSIQEANLEGVIIKNKIKNAALSFLPKLNLTKEKFQGKVGYLISEYAITNYTEYGPIFQTPRGPKSRSIKVTKNYFQDRKTKINPEKEEHLSQILEYAQVVLDKPNFSMKDLEKMVEK